MRAVCFIAVCAAAGAAGSPAAAQQVQELGPAPASWYGGSAGRISAVACSPTDLDRYFAAGADGGVWRTTDGGQTWAPLTDHMPTTAMGALAIDPADEDVIYAGTGEANFANHSRYGLGLYKSIDGGDTWTHLAEDVFGGRCFAKIVINPVQTQTLYASITRAGGFPELAAAKGHPGAAGPLGAFRSDDGGATWTHLSGGGSGLPDLSATDLVMDPSDPRTLYAGIGRIFGSSQNGIYKTTDGGTSWVKLSGGLPTDSLGRISVGIAPSNAARLYALITSPATSTGGGASTLGAYRSDDAGQTWTAINAGSFQATYGWYLSFISVQPTNPDAVFMGGLSLVRSTNAGATFSTVTPPHVDMHGVAWDAAGRLVVGDDGGVHRSTNLGASWSSLNTSIATVQFYAGLSTHPGDDLIVFGGTQDNGTNRRDSDSTLWTTVNGGDGGWTQLDQTSPNIVFAESQGTGNLRRSTTGGDSFNSASAGINTGDRNCFLPPYLIDPTNASRLLYATHRIYQSLDGGQNWTVISGDLTGGGGAAVRALAMGTDDPDTVYAATNDGRVLVSFDGGRSFGVVRSGNPGWPRVTREVFVDPADARIMYLAVASFDADQVLRTRDAGQTWETLDGDLPDLPVNVVAADRRATNTLLFAGTDSGLYRSIDDGATWRRYAPAVPNAAVIDLRLQRERCRLLVGTQGRGAWLVRLPGLGDFDLDGSINSRDFVAFLNAFVAGSDGADMDLDGTIDSRDFVLFLNAFVGEC